MEGGKSQISNVEWALIIGLVVLTDITQLVLDLFVVGVAINRFIDIGVAACMLLYFKIRGVKLNKARLGSIAAVFLGEMIPALDVAPFWSIDAVYIFFSVKAENSKLGSLATASASFKGKKPPPLPKGPPPLPKSPPPLTKEMLKKQGQPPRPGETGYGEPVNARALNLRQNIADFQQQARSSAEERSERLRQHAEKYREDIEKEIKDYGAGAREGQEYIRGEGKDA